jgi:hypothetical protein
MNRKNIALLVVLACAALAAEKSYTHQMAIALDFREERYTKDTYPLGSESCVNRDYTLDIGSQIVVLRQDTCHPNARPALAVTIGLQYPVIGSPAEGRMGFVSTKGKPIWLKIFKITQK